MNGSSGEENFYSDSEVEDITTAPKNDLFIDKLNSSEFTELEELSLRPIDSDDESEASISDIDRDLYDEDMCKFYSDRKLDRLSWRTKRKEIEAVLSSDPLDLEKLRQLACSSGGLLVDDLRKRAWPKLMQLNCVRSSPKPPWDYIQGHSSYNQVVLDVNRTLKRFPPGIEEQHRSVLMDQLTAIIVRVLDRHPHLHYYQGYHDVAITFLLVMGESMGFELVEKLSLSHLYEFMRPTMERTSFYLMYLYPVIKRESYDLFQYLMRSGVGTVFCLPWLITWYAHTLSDYRDVVRLYDMFLASPYLMPMYTAAAIVLHKEEEVMSGECDMAMQHFILSRIPDDLPLEDVLLRARQLYKLYPPDDLTEEVEQLIALRAKQEKEELERIARQKRLAWFRSGFSFFRNIPLVYSLTANGAALATLVAMVATGIYLKYYSRVENIL